MLDVNASDFDYINGGTDNNKRLLSPKKIQYGVDLD
jgi:hypothetical protein